MKLFRKFRLKKALAKRKTRLEDAKSLRQWKIERAKIMEKERIARIPETIARMRRLPVIELTQAEFDAMPRGETITAEWLQTKAPFDFKFISKRFPECPSDLITLGHLVKGLDAYENQLGATLSIPEKFINRYRVVIV